MTKRIALVHAVTAAMEPISNAFRELWPEAECRNILDDSLPGDLERSGGLTPAIFGRFDTLGNYAADIGADGLLFTCSAFGDAINAVARKARFPVLKPNEAMFEEALGYGAEIGMLATFTPSVASMESEFNAMAKARGSNARIRTICVPEAMAALRQGKCSRTQRAARAGRTATRPMRRRDAGAVLDLACRASRCRTAVDTGAHQPKGRGPQAAVGAAGDRAVGRTSEGA
jgi:hypothetical protein